MSKVFSLEIEENMEPTFPLRETKKVGAVIIGGNFQGLGVLRSLGKQHVPVYLLDQDLCIGRFSRYTTKFFRCPDVKQETRFLAFLTDLAIKEDLKGWVVYPNDDETVRFLAKNKESLEKYYRITTPSWDIVKFAYDKSLTTEAARRSGVTVPGVYYPRTVAELEQFDIKFPVILKPSVKEPFYNRTKKKAIKIDSRQELIAEYSRSVPLLGEGQVLMAQEFIPGGVNNLFSVGSLSHGGELLAGVVVRRTRQHPMDFGHATTYAETVDIPELEEMARKVLAEINFRGLSEVEFMLDPRDKKYKLLEINARPWGWHTLAIAAGVDLPYLSYLDILGKAVNERGFTKGVKWIRLTTDIPTVAIEIIKGRMKLLDYVKSLKGKKYDAVLSMKDPLPFLAEIALLPYLWKKRGF